jgi:hypothetical protein
MTRVVKKQDSNELDLEYVKRLAEEYKNSKQILEDIEKRTNGLKKELADIVIEHGVADDKGHMWVQVGDVKLKRERRVSRSFDTESARAWAEENGHWDEVKEVVEVISEDKMLGLAWTNKDLASTIQGFYVEKESWAFKV